MHIRVFKDFQKDVTVSVIIQASSNHFIILIIFKQTVLPGLRFMNYFTVLCICIFLKLRLYYLSVSDDLKHLVSHFPNFSFYFCLSLSRLFSQKS